jgi:hypothetical protein
MNPLEVIADELRPLLNRIRAAKEVLGNGGLDSAYEANKMLEPVLFRLSDLIAELEK